MFVCAGLVLGAVGVGAHYLNNRDTSANVTNAEPLFARSVGEAELPAGRSRAVRLDVPYYGPMVELLTLGASAGRTATADRSAPQGHTEEARGTPRVLKEAAKLRKQQKQAWRPKEEKRRNNAVATENDAREAYARDVPERKQRRGWTPRRYDEDQADRARRSRPLDVHETTDRRRQEGSRQPSRNRSLARDGSRERGRRDTRGPENRDSGFTPFRMFGIFDQR
jgi:hypothetical protein